MSSTELVNFFAQEVNHNHSLKEKFMTAYQTILLPAEKVFIDYCQRVDIYQAYVEQYYGQHQWFAFQPSSGGNSNTSMVDIVAEMLQTRIVIWQKINGVLTDIYRTKTKFEVNKEMNLEFIGNNHFVSRDMSPIQTKSMARVGLNSNILLPAPTSPKATQTNLAPISVSTSNVRSPRNI